MRVVRRLLTTPEAAAYVGSRSVAAFRRQCKRGLWPPPYRSDTKPLLWDIKALDAWIDRAHETPTEPELEDLL